MLIGDVAVGTSAALGLRDGADPAQQDEGEDAETRDGGGAYPAHIQAGCQPCLTQLPHDFTCRLVRRCRNSGSRALTRALAIRCRR